MKNFQELSDLWDEMIKKAKEICGGTIDVMNPPDDGIIPIDAGLEEKIKTFIAAETSENLEKLYPSASNSGYRECGCMTSFWVSPKKIIMDELTKRFWNSLPDIHSVDYLENAMDKINHLLQTNGCQDIANRELLPSLAGTIRHMDVSDTEEKPWYERALDNSNHPEVIQRALVEKY